MKNYSLSAAIRQLMNTRKIEKDFEGEINDEGLKEFRTLGLHPYGQIFLPVNLIGGKQVFDKRTAILAGSGGAAFVPTEVNQYIHSFYDKSVLTGLGARMITGLSGNQQIPVSGGVNVAWEGESDAGIDGTPTVTGHSSKPIRLGAFVSFSGTLLRQTENPSVDIYLRDEIIKAIISAVEKAAINGSGSGEPLGILNTSGIGSVAGGDNGSQPDQDDLADLEKALADNKADIESLAYLTNPKVRALLKKTPVDAGAGDKVWDVRTPGLLYGYPAGVTTSVPDDLTKGTGSNLSAIIFGNFSDLQLLQWGGFDITVDYWTNAKNNIVNMVINSFWNVVVARASSFAAMKDAVTS